MTSVPPDSPDPTPSPAEARPVPAAVAPPTLAADAALDRTIDFGRIGWATLLWAVVLVAAAALRFGKLGEWALSPAEARHAWDAWTLFRGQPAPAGDAIPTGAPLPLLLQSLAFFLFGVTDATARIVSAAAGLGIVLLVPLLRRWVGGPEALAMAGLAAVSPILVWASRVGDAENVVAFLALLLVVALLRAAGDGEGGPDLRWAALAGFAAAGLPSSGPSGVSVLLTLLVAMAAAGRDRDGAVHRGLAALLGRRGLTVFLGAALVTLLTLFTRFWSEPAAISGVWLNLRHWLDLLTGPGNGTPTSYFLIALLLYEPLALLLGLVGAARTRALPAVPSIGTLLGTWFLAALLLWSFSGGRAPSQAVHVALPLVLLAGAVLGGALRKVDWDDVRRGDGGLLLLCLVGFVVSLVALLITLARTESGAREQVVVPAMVITMLVVVPLAWAIWTLADRERRAGRAGQTSRVVLVAALLFLGGYGVRNATQLVLGRAATGEELIAQQTSTAAVRPALDRLNRLSRDVSVENGSVRDVTGSFGLTVAAERDVEWPFRWYFRDYPDFSVVGPGEGPASGAQVVIARSGDGMAAAGYAPQPLPWLNGVPAAFADPDPLGLAKQLVNPFDWLAGLKFAFFREGVDVPPPSEVVLGLSADLAARVSPSTGPRNIGDHSGAGSGPGQVSQPVGIAVAPDGTIAVVDQGNARIVRFNNDGTYRDAWGPETGLVLGRTDSGLGPTGIAYDPTGLAWVADTWNHRVIALDPSGRVVRELGGAATGDGAHQAADTGDDPANVGADPGEFFGPRAVAVAGDEVYVVDTGNERVQVFGEDGQFRRVWGGYGSGPGNLIEPVGIAIGPDGLVYVADSGNQRISRFRPDGAPVDQWAVPAWPAHDPTGVRPSFQPYLAFGPDGALYASASDHGSVEVLDRRGATVASVTSAGNQPLQQPVGVAVTASGLLLVTDFGASAVDRIVPPALPPSGPASPMAGATPAG